MSRGPSPGCARNCPGPPSDEPAAAAAATAAAAAAAIASAAALAALAAATRRGHSPQPCHSHSRGIPEPSRCPREVGGLRGPLAQARDHLSLASATATLRATSVTCLTIERDALSSSGNARTLVSIVVDIVCALVLTLVIAFVGGLVRVLVLEIVPVLVLLLLLALLPVRILVHVPLPVSVLVIVRVPVLAL